MIAIRFLVLCGAALLVAACLPVTTKVPIGSTAGFHADPALLGIWKGHGDDADGKDGYIVFLKDGEDGMTAILFGPDGSQDEWESFAIRTATLGGHAYMSARMTLKNGKPAEGKDAEQDIALAYRIAGGKLTLALLDEKATAVAIQAGRIAGTVDSGSMGDVHITADAAEEDAFFATKEGAALFSETLLTMKKLD